MLGSYRKRGCTCKKKRCTCGAKWHYRYDITDPLTGKRKQKETKGYATKPEVEEAAKKIMAELVHGTYIEETNITFEKFANQWIELYASSGKVKISTVDIRKAKLKCLTQHFKEIKLKDITKKMYQDTLNILKKKYSKKTIASIHETGSLIFKKALEFELIPKDITLQAETGYTQKSVSELEEEIKLPAYLEKEELALFLTKSKEMYTTLYYAMFLLLAYSGIRIGEAIALKWKDINFNEQTISISKTLYNKGSWPDVYVINTPKTKRSRRIIDIDEKVLTILEELRKHQEALRENKKIGSYFHDDFVFARDDKYFGHPVTHNQVLKRMKSILKAAELNGQLSPHSLRHTHTSLLAEADVSLEQIMDRLGHQNDRVTKEVYLHVTKSRKKEASQKFAELMRSL